MESAPGEGLEDAFDAVLAAHVDKLRDRVRQTRCFTVFLSSPFGGMELERADLVQRHLPSLKALAEARGVQLAVVDLRWGITAEQANASLVIPLCLKEIDRSDVFVGFLGARYGTSGIENEFIQKSIDKALPQWPWLAQMRDRSITELEFRQGSLNQPSVRPSIFFLRDPVHDAREAAAAPDTAHKYQIESETAAGLKAELLAELGELSAEGKVGLVQGYQDPAAGASLIAERLSRLLDQILPQAAPDLSTMEDTQHYNFSVSRVGTIFSGREEELEALLAYTTTSTVSYTHLTLPTKRIV
eukprot:TRINITY_DN31158_c0_g1_i1.p1 TRINITY_DN31158_c0_g1~~TRINITY_DN31158_c0_g1_i1.p1  ORF type:complete len:301 (+),score=85.84 TRINITY_DN31158_c0_g1_i1:113-1015(+)